MSSGEFAAGPTALPCRIATQAVISLSRPANTRSEDLGGVEAIGYLTIEEDCHD